MKEAQWTVDADFVVKGFGLTGVTQPNDANKAIFVSEASLDTAIATIHKAVDRPYLTLNDKVYAARHSLGVLTPL